MVEKVKETTFERLVMEMELLGLEGLNAKAAMRTATAIPAWAYGEMI